VLCLVCIVVLYCSIVLCLVCIVVLYCSIALCLVCIVVLYCSIVLYYCIEDVSAHLDVRSTVSAPGGDLGGSLADPQAPHAVHAVDDLLVGPHRVQRLLARLQVPEHRHHTTHASRRRNTITRGRNVKDGDG